jgi:hypothetical protein
MAQKIQNNVQNLPGRVVWLQLHFEMLSFCIILHGNFEDINIFSKKPPGTSKVIKK